MRHVHRRSNYSISRHSRPSPLAACLLAALGLGGFAESALAATVIVSRCDDPDRLIKGGYSLRQAIGHANDGDFVDASGLTCSTITLALGEIAIADNNLVVQGPSSHTLAIDANHQSRVFNHTGSGSLDLASLDLVNGSAFEGGCVKSLGAILLNHSTVSGCNANAGGGTYSVGNTSLLSSNVTGNSASTGSGGGVLAVANVQAIYSSISGNSGFRGGGVYAIGNVNLSHTLIGGNQAIECGGLYFKGTYLTLTSSTVDSNAATHGGGGGLCGKTDSTPRTVTLNATTVSNNTAYFSGGGIRTFGCVIASPYDARGTNLTLSNSTISGNTSGSNGGGVDISCGHVAISNSTIVFNSAPVGGGIHAQGLSSFAAACNFGIQSSIVAKNSGNTGVHDLYLTNCWVRDGSNYDLIDTSNYTLPWWLTGDPRLATLADNGGPVRTHALLANSPAIDAGSNADNLTTDARGSGYPRVLGGSTDIGAYEYDPAANDLIFANGFD